MLVTPVGGQIAVASGPLKVTNPRLDMTWLVEPQSSSTTPLSPMKNRFVVPRMKPSAPGCTAATSRPPRERSRSFPVICKSPALATRRLPWLSTLSELMRM